MLQCNVSTDIVKGQILLHGHGRMMNYRLVLLLISFFFFTACQEKPQAPMQPPAANVDVALPVKHEIVEWDEYTGRFEAVNRVDVRARVTGYLVEKHFKDGQMVKKGDVLFVIDPRGLQFERDRALASYTLAQRDYERAKRLRRNNAVSEEDLDRRLQQLKVAKASLGDAKLALTYTQVTAPIDGKIADNFLDVGNLVRENDTVLTRIVSLNPIHFEFEASQAQLLKYIRLDRAGTRPGSDKTANPIFIKLQDETQYLHSGRMDFVDNVVDTGTGTIKGRALIGNSQSILVPGMFGKARVIGRPKYQAILIPERALNTDQNRKFVYVLNTANQAERRYVVSGKLLDNGLLVIKQGLNANDKIIISGLQRIRMNKQPVKPELKTIEWQEPTSMPKIDTVPSIEAIKLSASLNQ